jgi:hypothetical protein
MASLINAVLILLTMLVLASLLIDGGDRPVAAVVLDADAISQTDTDGADIISLLAGELKARGVTLAGPRAADDPGPLDQGRRDRRVGG